MKSFGAIAFFLVTVLVAGAQSDLSAVAPTNVPALDPVVAVKAMSLQDCIQEALQHNFDLQIVRYEPGISLYNLRGDYGDYDPTLSASAEHDWNRGAFDTNTIAPLGGGLFFYPRSNSDENQFGSDIGGGTPWGMTYDLVANLDQTYNNKYSGVTNLTAEFKKDTTSSVELDLKQHLLKDFWIDSTRLSIRVGKNRLKWSEQKMRQQFNESITDIANAYYELIFARESVKVQQEALDLAKTQLDQDRQRSRIGTLAELDVQQDEAQVAKNQAKWIEAEGTLTADENVLKALITDNYRQWHDIDIQPSEALTATLEPFNLQDSWDKGLSTRPELVQARLDVEAQGFQLKFDRNQLFPSLDLFGSYGYNGEARDYDGAIDELGRADRPYYKYGIEFSIPLGNISARNTLKAHKLTAKQLLLTLKKGEQDVMVQIDDALKNARTKYQSVQATHQARIYAEAALNAEQKKYDVGKSTTFTVLQLQNSLTSARSDEIRALADYNQALADLAKAEGSTLERNRIDIDVDDATPVATTRKSSGNSSSFVK
ncbi:MAG TPA: TolC family protein [Desulfuromonadaceae bacterium]|nr:TolC family protein [Desulfuromonadaceae bacterium]